MIRNVSYICFVDDVSLGGKLKETVHCAPYADTVSRHFSSDDTSSTNKNEIDSFQCVQQAEDADLNQWFYTVNNHIIIICFSVYNDLAL
jgi:hypothetical protein